MNTTKRPIIVSHRGGKGPTENTPEAYRRAVEQGAEAVEMDIRHNVFTGHFFLAHDFIHHPKRRQNFLEKAIAEVPRDVLLVLEFKTLSCFTNIFVNAFMRYYHEYLQGRDVLVISFNPFVLMRLRRAAPDIPRGFICGSGIWLFIYHLLLWRFVDAKYCILNRRFVNQYSVRWARKRGIFVFTYVINSLKLWHKALHLDVDGIITDYPDQFMELRANSSP